MDTEQIEKLAMQELAAEENVDAINAAKQRIRERRMRPLWHRLFPFVITITRRP